MNFLYPTFLFGFIALAVPVIIHLFNFQKPREVKFTNLAFLRNIKEANSAKLKLKHYLVLLSRLCFIAFLVLAFAQPVLKGINPELLKGKNKVGFYLDNSLSMENMVDGEKVIDASVKAVNSVSELFSKETKFLFLSNDFESKDQFFKNKDKLLERVTEVSLSPVSRDGNSVFKRLNNGINKEQDGRGNLFIFSDFQKSTFGSLEEVEIDSALNYYLVPIRSTEVANVIIDSVWLEEPLIRANENTVLKVRLSNKGASDVKGISVKMFLNEVQVNTAMVDILSGASVATEFTFSVNDTVSYKGEVKIEDSPIRFDNSYYFVLNPTKSINIYHIHAGKGGSIDKVFENEKLFQLESDPVGQVDYSKIRQSDLVIVNEIAELPEALIESINEALRNGADLLVIPAEKINADSYRRLIKSDLNVSVPDTTQKNSFTLLPPDFDNPFFAGIFEKPEKGLSMPYAVPVIKLANEGSAILKYRNQENFVLRYQSTGKGNIYIFRTPLSPALTNFHRHALFVPVMYKIAFLSYAGSGKLAFNFNEQVVTLKLQNTEKNSVFSLENEGGKYIPSQKLIDKTLYLDLPSEKLKAGFYRVKGNLNEEWIGLNYGKNESDMNFYSVEELKKYFEKHNNVTVFEANNGEEFLETFKNVNIGTPLWKYCLILALLFLLTEILLIRFFRA